MSDIFDGPPGSSPLQAEEQEVEGGVWSADEIAVRFHHQLVLIHPFPNGNGRHARLAADVAVEALGLTGGERVLDVGTGTGILAVAALRLGAREALGFDVDPWSVENATESAALNGVSDRFTVREGGIEVVPETGFDLILANVHLEVLCGLVPLLAEKLLPAGRLVLAGLLTMQQAPMVEAVASAGLALHAEATEGEWWGCICEKR